MSLTLLRIGMFVVQNVTKHARATVRAEIAAFSIMSMACYILQHLNS